MRKRKDFLQNRVQNSRILSKFNSKNKKVLKIINHITLRKSNKYLT